MNQKGNSKKEQEHCKELPPRKLHLSNLQPDNGKLRNFHSQNSTQESLAEEERFQHFLASSVHLGNFSPRQRKARNCQPGYPTQETPPRKFLCRKRQASKSLKFQKMNQKGNSKKEQEHCKELPPRKLHLSNLQPDNGKLRNFHSQNSTQESLAEEERFQHFLASSVHLGNFSPRQRKARNCQPGYPTQETPPRKFLCRKRQASKSLKFQKGNSKKEQEHCKELPPRKLHLINLQPDNGKLRNFHSQNSAQESLAEEERFQQFLAREVHLGNSSPRQRKGKNYQPGCPTQETPPRKFLCRKRQASKSLKFQKMNQKGNSKKEQEHCKELPPRKLHLSNLQPDNGKLRNFHSQNSTQVSLAEEERFQHFLAR